MATIARNKMVPVIGIAALVIIIAILFIKFRGNSARGPAHGATAAGAHAESNLPPAAGADRDNPTETLKTVVADQKVLRDQVQQILAENQRLQQQLQSERNNRNLAAPAAPLGGSNPATNPGTISGNNSQVNSGAGPFPPLLPQPASPPGSRGSSAASAQGVGQSFDKALQQASEVIDTVSTGPGSGRRPAGGAPMGYSTMPSGAGPMRLRSGPYSGSPNNRANGMGMGMGIGGNALGDGALSDGLLTDDQGYRILAPMGYQPYSVSVKGQPTQVSYVRANPGMGSGALQNGARLATSAAAQAAATGEKARPLAIPYFTLPENSTLVGVVSMTSLIGRIPIEGRVTDPYPFKAVIGRDNLAANGMDLPDDITGMIVSGIAVGDMALSCSEGKIYSATFIFNDGTVRTVSERRGGSVNTQSSSGSDGLGYISDLHGNPCIQGKFVTNAPAFLTDMATMGTLTAVGDAYATAQQTVSQTATSGTTSAVTGSMRNFAIGQGVGNSASEITKWLLAREKNSFDAVVTPAGEQLVVHLSRQIDLDKAVGARKLVHRTQTPPLEAGLRYGLE